MPYLRFGHLQKPSQLKVGQVIKRGDIIGYVGSTGHAKGSHLHLDIFRDEPVSPFEYVQGLSKERVRALYIDPAPYCKDNIPVPNTLRTGYSYLQWTGSLYHPGLDMNSPNDTGHPIYSPVDGIVYFVSPNGAGYDHGWGNLVLIKETTMDNQLGLRLQGRFLLDVDNRGRLWYIDYNGKRWEVGKTPEECVAFLMKMAAAKIPLGIKGEDLNKIPVA